MHVDAGDGLTVTVRAFPSGGVFRLTAWAGIKQSQEIFLKRGDVKNNDFPKPLTPKMSVTAVHNRTGRPFAVRFAGRARARQVVSLS